MITARGLRKRYPGDVGLAGVDLDVPAGTVCGLLGPNGAGKTTAVRILTTLVRADDGEARVAGFDVRTQGDRVREAIGLVGQHAAVDDVLTGRQNLVLFGRLNHLGGTAATSRATELLERFDLVDAADRPAAKYSGGMRRRLDLAASLVTAPRVLFVDEPTTGLDPAGRREVWTAIRALVGGGTTVLLTTQYLEEADELADRIVLLRDGLVAAEGTPAELKSRVGDDWLEIVLRSDADVVTAESLARPFAAGETHVDAAARSVRVPVLDRGAAILEVAIALRAAGVTPEDLSARRPTLDEVFLHVTGHAADRPPIAGDGDRAAANATAHAADRTADRTAARKGAAV